MVKAAWGAIQWAFSRELPPEKSSRCGRVAPLKAASVIALLSAPKLANRGWYRGRNAFRPECRDGRFIFL